MPFAVGERVRVAKSSGKVAPNRTDICPTSASRGRDQALPGKLKRNFNSTPLLAIIVGATALWVLILYFFSWE